jgi:glycosyltransferase involved in cell wall biosynthesis
MKLLYISHSSEIQGSGRALLNIIQEMIQKGIQVKVIIPKASGEFFEEINKLNIEYSVQPVVSWIWPRLKTFRDYLLFPYRFVRLITKSLFFYNSLSKKVKSYQPDIIHTNVGVVHIGHFVAKKLNIPHVWHNREYQDLDFGWKPFPSKRSFFKKLHDLNNHPIEITKGVYNHHNMELNENATIIYDGVFDGTIVNSIELNKSKYFLFVGSISEGKGTTEAVNAFISISKQFPDYELWIAGGGSKSIIDELKSKIIIAGCSEKVHFLGYRKDIYKLMSKATALIVPSRFEGFGFITAEAMYNGCLVIGKNNAGTKEQFDNGLNLSGEEIGIRYNTTEELISIMQNLCGKGIEAYHKTIELAQKTVIELYSTQKNANEIYNYYKKILNK